VSETVQVAIIVALTGVVGPALMGELRDWLRRRRRDAERRRSRQVKALDETYAMLSALIDAAQHMAVGDVEAKDVAMAEVRAQRTGSIWLVGRADVIREYQDLLGDTQSRLGQTIRAEDAVLALQVLGRVSEALEAQKERARRGKRLLEVSPEDRKALGDAEALAAKMIPIDRYPSIPARLARRAVLTLNRLKASRIGWAKRPPEDR
jgi:DNA-binding PucR family transcriptional regulator